jgi:FMN phosphatase YigB (HAD superfamily)
MDIFVFDIDDTIVLHTNEGNDYYNSNGNTTLRDLLSEFENLNCYIYTNGTFGHGKAIVDNLDLHVDMIFARDVIPYMKPERRSFMFVNNEIKQDIRKQKKTIKEIIFFDDLKDNLKMAKHFGWTTVLINPNLKEKENFIDYVFPNIYESIIYFKLKE